MDDLTHLTGIGKETAKKLSENGLETFMSIAVSGPSTIAELCGLSENKARVIIRESREKLRMGFDNAIQYSKKREHIKNISTGCNELDRILGGGFESSAITEIYGRTASGKTQLSHLMVVKTIQADKNSKAIYIDSESTFRAERIKDFCEANKMNYEDTMSKIFVARSYNSLPEGEQVIINTIDGLKKINIDNFVEKNETKTNSFNQKTGLNKISKITRYIKHDYKLQKLIKIKTKSGREITVTNNHSLFCGKRIGSKGKETKRKELNNMRPYSILAKDMKIGSHIALPSRIDCVEKDVTIIDLYDLMKESYYSKSYKKIMNKVLQNNDNIWWYKTGKKESKKIKRTLIVDNDFMWLLGILYAEGSTRGGLTFWTEENLIKRIERIVLDKFGIKMYRQKQKNGFCSKLYSHFISKIMEKMGICVRKTHKNIPDWILSLPKEKIEYFLYGFWEGDGNHHSIHCSLEFYNSDKNLINDLNILLLRLNKFAHIQEYDGYYHLSIYGLESYNIIGLYNIKQNLNKCIFGNIIFDTIEEIEEVKYTGKFLYDFEVGDDNIQNFIGGYGTIYCHNTDHQILLVDEVEKLLQKDNSYRIIVIDSLTSHFRANYSGRGELADRQQKLNKHLHQLLKLADVYNLVVILTNQVQSDPGMAYGNPEKPIGGNIMSHAATNILYLRPSKAGTYVAKLVDSPSLPSDECVYTITKNGIEDV